jgi:hypothetical protein
MTRHRRPRRLLPASLLLLLASPCGAAEATAVEAPPGAEPAGGATGAAPRWELSGTVSAYFLPDDEDYLLPIVSADRGTLHLETRYNYEDIGSGSLFAGWNFEHDDRVQVAVTPMAGVVFGATEGFAPGFEFTLGYKKLELYTEFEYLFDREDTEANFLYSWSELTYAPVDWFRFGLTTQKTRVYHTNRDIQRALLLGWSVSRFTITAHLFNPGDEDTFYVLAIGAGF